MVASTIITLSGQALLNKFAIGLAGEAGTWVFKQILHSASGGSDADKIRRDISGAVTEMKELKRTVDTLSRELPEALLQLRSDNLRESLTKIETMYDTITDLIETAVTLPEDISDAERDKKLMAIQTRLEDRLRMFSNDIPGILDRINDFLAEDGPRSFLRQAVQKAFDSSDDFVSYYEKSKTSMLSYWVVVVKGIALLQMAYDAPNVDFSEGMLTIRRQKDKLDRQEQTFKAVVGENTVRLVNSALSEYFPTNVSLLTHEGLWMGPRLIGPIFVSWSYGSESNRIALHGRSGDTYRDRARSQWEIIFGQCMQHDGPNVFLVPNDSQCPSHSILWFVKPVCPGSDRYTIRAAQDMTGSSGPFRGSRWQPDLGILRPFIFRSGFLGSHLVARDVLKLEDYVSPSDTGREFQIKV
ncbi:uncharacterized protein FTJAE_1727 [Fusarium tjaetaba]|uniref:Uncharacterized protein n=1 Tax=Fusarium tjaetaba TaxID=1567544 RepID=A0A8H5SAQ9_9HYPO|nr:uncharacterized protein FTJAE_1727 [Fusarium tjaetaba]KAF5647670.1 hypothetical protein FTJAE_1727 [Fusarium tjaetaba]